MEMSRKEYKRQYYLDNQKKIIKQSRKDYKKNRKKRLSNKRNYYKDNREIILGNKKVKSLAFRGHAHSIWSAVRKYAKRWKLPMCNFDEFYANWTVDDPKYQQLYDAWVESGHNENLSPVVMRKVKKDGYVPSNLDWDVKNNYSWWNEDSKVFKEVEFDLNEIQKAKNKSNKEFRKKLRDEWKAKLKAKKQ
jgi:hypothetical protein